MYTIPHSQRYLPHDLNTRFYACQLYASRRYSIAFVCRRYKISKASLMRWMKRFDGSKESLVAKSHKPLSRHPNAHTEIEISWIKNYLRRNPTISMIELYSKLKPHKGYSRHPASLFRFLRKQGFYRQPPTHSKPYVPKPYDTPTQVGIKWQLDGKYVPTACKASSLPHDKKFYQYTMIDEASRERFLYYYDEQTSTSTVDFIQRAITYYRYQSLIIQTDNGTEFTHLKTTNRIHPMDILCQNLGITHQLIRPRTPRHNGKVERSHRNDNERFYRYLQCYSLEDLRKQGKAYLRRSNHTAMATLGYLTPIEMRAKLSS